MAARPKWPPDLIQLTKVLLDIATGEKGNVNPGASKVRPRMGGLKGGKARIMKLSSRKQRKTAKRTARTRWGKGPIFLRSVSLQGSESDLVSRDPGGFPS